MIYSLTIHHIVDHSLHLMPAFKYQYLINFQ